MSSNDLAGIEHWEMIYHKVGRIRKGWRPANYDSLTLAHALTSEIKRHEATNILEVGCGNSVWLPYLAQKARVAVAGLDYSQEGCELARQRLSQEEVLGEIFCDDLFHATSERIGQYDFVFSLGLVEHFASSEEVVAKLLEFVKPGGLLFTEVPNLRSIHGLLSWVWQPKLLAMHQLISKEQLLRNYKRLGLRDIHGRYCGLFSLNIVAWELYPRWPMIAPLLLPFIRKIHLLTDVLLCRIKRFEGIQPFAPFLYVVGQKPA
jgi:2-polyprenyl-6-hydroxyphenyl methylase/3-demethylubiquinone-9 3-methyltransferase